MIRQAWSSLKKKKIVLNKVYPPGLPQLATRRARRALVQSSLSLNSGEIQRLQTSLPLRLLLKQIHQCSELSWVDEHDLEERKDDGKGEWSARSKEKARRRRVEEVRECIAPQKAIEVSDA